jgi:uncharacterized protein with von Willebrand factor type A (vWA) domain
MAFEIEYFHERVLVEVETWPVDVLADYAKLVERLAEHVQTCGCHTRVRSVAASLSFDPRPYRDRSCLLLFSDGQTDSRSPRFPQEVPAST